MSNRKVVLEMMGIALVLVLLPLLIFAGGDKAKDSASSSKAKTLIVTGSGQVSAEEADSVKKEHPKRKSAGSSKLIVTGGGQLPANEIPNVQKGAPRVNPVGAGTLISTGSGQLPPDQVIEGTKQPVPGQLSDLEWMRQLEQAPLTDLDEQLFLLDGKIWMRSRGEYEFHLGESTNDVEAHVRDRVAALNELGATVELDIVLDLRIPEKREFVSNLGMILIPMEEPGYFRATMTKPEIAEISSRGIRYALYPDYPSERLPHDDGVDDKPQINEAPADSRAVIFSETFEGDFPGSWNVGDNNATNGLDYWDDISCRSYSGDWSAWCADIGDMPDCGYYDDNMFAYMFIGNDVSGYENVNLSYWLWLQTELNFDFVRRYYSADGVNWTLSQEFSGNSNGWINPNVGVTNFTTYWVMFVFYSDGSVHTSYEGAYLDDIVITGDPIADQVHICDAWWTDTVDTNGDGCWESARLHWDADLDDCSGTVEVYEKIYSRSPCGSGGWSLIGETTPYTITDCLSSDARYVDLSYDDTCRSWDVLIELYRVGEASPDDIYGPTNDGDLACFDMGHPPPVDSVHVYNTWWTNEVDADGDGCPESARLNWDANLDDCSGSEDVYEKIYARSPCGGGTWNFLATTTSYTITDCSSSDARYMDLTNSGPCSSWDFLIDLYRMGESSPDDTYGPTDDPDIACYDMGQPTDPDIRVEPMSLTIEEECRSSAGTLEPDFEYVPPEKRIPAFDLPHQAGQLIVKIDYTKDIVPTYGAAGFRTGLESIDAICTQFNIQKARPVFRNLNRSPLLNNTFILEVTAPYSLEAAAMAFFESELVEVVELNCVLDAVVVPNDPDYSSQWGLAKISMPQAWDVSNGNTSVSIAIVDTGVDWDHVDLGANIWSNPGEIPGNGIDDDGNGFIDDIRGWDFVDGATVPPGEDGNTPDNNPDDVHGHGTHVAGIASAATNNSTGVAGVGWNCKIMPVRAGWLGTDGGGHMYYADGAAAFVYAADNGACAINFSFTSYNAGTILSNAAQYAFNQGAVVCVGAANNDIDDPGTLGNLSTTISVAATNNSDIKASFSNFGTWVDVSAPGVSIRSTVIGDGYESWQGTSMAAPFVAGLVGLVCSVDPSLGPAEIMSLIKDNTDNIDAQNPSYIGMLGTGRINAAATLQAIDGGGSDVFVVYNDGAGLLNVSDITSTQPWLSANPPTSFAVAAGGSRTVSVVVDWNQLGSNPESGQLRVWSDDPDENENPVSVDVLAIPCDEPPQMISGYVRDGAGVGIPDVTMTFAGLTPVSTNSNGYYERLVPYDWSGRVTPSKECWAFTPSYRDYSNVITPQTNQDYIGEQATFVISGYVRDTSGVGIPGVQMSGFPAPPVMTDDYGFYVDTVPCGWSGMVQPAEYCHTFTPPSRSYSNVMANTPGQDYVGTPIPVTISGFVRDSTGAGIPGVTMNGLPCTPTPVTGTDGSYSCDVPCGWDGTVTPSMDGYSFDPPSSTYQHVVDNLTDEDYTGYPLDCDPGFEIAWVMGAQDSVVGVPVIANGMQSTPIAGLEFHLTYPSDCLLYDSVGAGYLDGATVNGAGGEVHIIWEDFANPIMVPDGDAINTIWFTILGSEGDTCEMCWLPGNEVVDPIGDPIAGLGYCCGGVVVDENHSISGNVVYYDMVKKIPGVQVDLTGAAIAGTVTDAAGHYAFANLASGNYVVTPSHNADDPGASVADIIKIRRHLAVLEPFTSGYQLIAGDVTCDCAVSVSDIIKIRRYLAVLDTLPCGNWAFVDSSYHVTTTDWCPVPAEINTMLASNQTDSSFVGVRKGDVNNTWSPSAAATAGRQGDAHATAGEMTLTMNDGGAKGETVTLPVTLGRGTPVAGVELHLQFDPQYLAFAGLKSEVMNDVTMSHDESSVHLVWENLGQPIDLAVERILADFEFTLLNEPDEFTEVEITSAELVDESGTPFVLSRKNGRVMASSGVVDETLPGDFWLGQNYPNPFNPETDIAFYLPRQVNVMLAIYNMLGQQVTILASGQLAAGLHTVHWDGRDASGRPVSSGIYLYRLNSSEFTESRKMLLLK